MSYFQSILRGLGQMMFQNHVYSGVLSLMGILCNSFLLGVAALLGAIVSTSTAHFLRLSKVDIQNGLYGFNGALLGVALWYFFGFTSVTFIASMVGAALTTILRYYLKKIINPFTAPFILVAWIAISLLLFVFNIPLIYSSPTTESTLVPLSALVKSFGQVFFQENTLSGLFFILAMIVNSKIYTIYGLYAAILGFLVAMLLGEPISAVNAGLFGYNAILCAIVLADNKRESFVWVSIATFLSVILFIGFSKSGIIALTAPFVLSTWMILKLRTRNLLTKRNARRSTIEASERSAAEG